MNKKRIIWKNLGLALAATPVVAFVGFIVIALIGDAITVFQLDSCPWWVILIVAYVLSLIYFIYEPTFRINREREKVINALILYWKDQLAKQNKPQDWPSVEEKEVREMFLERLEVWAGFDPELWNRYFPNEKYSEYLFGIVDNLMAYCELVKKIAKTQKLEEIKIKGEESAKAWVKAFESKSLCQKLGGMEKNKQ